MDVNVPLRLHPPTASRLICYATGIITCQLIKNDDHFYLKTCLTQFVAQPPNNKIQKYA